MEESGHEITVTEKKDGEKSRNTEGLSIDR